MFSRLSLFVCAGLAFGVWGCPASDKKGVSPGDSDASSLPDNEIPKRECATQFSYKPSAGQTVALAGEWDWTARTEMTDSDGDGSAEARLDLPAGAYGYKFIVSENGQNEQWILDPTNPYRRYNDGTENSAARVEDCSLPRIVASPATIADGKLTASFQIWRGANPIDTSTLNVVLRHNFEETAISQAKVSAGGKVSIELSDLAAGKYTLVAQVSDQAAQTSETTLLPFWIEPNKFDWRGALIYMAMIDRFVNGQPSNDSPKPAGVAPDAMYHGGDFAGLTKAIASGEFDKLGVTAMWLSPFVRNSEKNYSDEGHTVSAYHGYWPIFARQLEPRFGTEHEFEELVKTAHAHGIRILMDFVINHAHEDHEYVKAHPDWFRKGCLCGTAGCDWTERRLDCSFRSYLPDVNWQNYAAGEQMIADAMWWLERFDLDGLRVDAVKHVEDAAIANLSTRIHERFEQGGVEYFLLGETAMGWSGSDVAANQSQYDTIGRYIGQFGLNGQFDFVLYHATAYRVWADNQFGFSHLDFWTKASLAHYPPDAIMTSFLGSHDSERILSLVTYGSDSAIVRNKWSTQTLPEAAKDAGPYQKSALAFTWLLTTPGAPLLYYGDEYGEYGGGDPDNRHDWRASKDRTSAEKQLAESVGAVGRLRKELRALRQGNYQTLSVAEKVLVYARQIENEVAIVGLNSAADATDLTVTLPAEVSGTTWIDRLHDNAQVIQNKNALTLRIPAGGAVLLTPQ